MGVEQTFGMRMNGFQIKIPEHIRSVTRTLLLPPNLPISSGQMKRAIEAIGKISNTPVFPLDVQEELSAPWEDGESIDDGRFAPNLNRLGLSELPKDTDDHTSSHRPRILIKSLVPFSTRIKPPREIYVGSLAKMENIDNHLVRVPAVLIGSFSSDMHSFFPNEYPERFQTEFDRRTDFIVV